MPSVFFLHAYSHSRSLVISKYLSGSIPSMFARLFRVTASAFSTFCMPGLELVKRAHKASTCAVAGALLPSKLARYHPACLHLQEKICQRIIPHVCICKRRSASVSSRMSASAREDLPAYHPACLHLQEKISQRIIPHVEDLPAYHPACLHLQEKISQPIITHVCI